MAVLEPAQAGDIEICMDIMREGRRFQQEQGFIQWTDRYPGTETIQNDIRNKTGYLLKTDGRIAGYMCVDFAGEPDYADIAGSWRSDGPYAVVHRLAFQRQFRGIGLAAAAFALIENLCVENGIYTVRADTDFQNKRMWHLLKKNGFEYCGSVVIQGSEKLAFDKLL